MPQKIKSRNKLIIIQVLQSLRPVYAHEFIRAGVSWNFQKDLSRLRRDDGFDIRTISEPGQEGIYQLFPRQEKLI